MDFLDSSSVDQIHKLIISAWGPSAANEVSRSFATNHMTVLHHFMAFEKQGNFGIFNFQNAFVNISNAIVNLCLCIYSF